MLEHVGLAGAVRAAAHAAGERGGLSVDVHCEEGLRHPQEQLVFTAARELLTNVVKHAAARHVTVRLTGHAGGLRLEITDDGRGIKPASAERAPAAGHIGLASQRIRIESAGGTLTLTPATPCGTRALVDLPPPAL
ncbi:sensor histidine kinase [Streptomyces spinoverrucosus]|uniref:sensor histidine kinase n=1 Tax=Streptomyces spinoverrucosus TaxID=284043 RepID=UPI00142EAB9A|nr:ATP-binding protein [Streptomyces spinoverrucosus]